MDENDEVNAWIEEQMFLASNEEDYITKKGLRASLADAEIVNIEGRWVIACESALCAADIIHAAEEASTHILVPPRDYVDLVVAQEALSRLDEGGVDSWGYYDEAINPEGELSINEFRVAATEEFIHE